MRLIDLTWEQLEPMIDSGMFLVVSCPTCDQTGRLLGKEPELRLADAKDTPNGWQTRCIECRQPVDPAEVSVARKDVAEAAGYVASVYRLDVG